MYIAVWHFFAPLFLGLIEVVVIFVLGFAQPLQAATQTDFTDFSFGDELVEVVVCKNGQAAGSLGVLWKSHQVEAVRILLKEFARRKVCGFRQYPTIMMDGLSLKSQEEEQQNGAGYTFSIIDQSGQRIHFSWPLIFKEGRGELGWRARD